MERHYRHRDSISRPSESKSRTRSRSRSRSPDRSDRRKHHHHHHHRLHRDHHDSHKHRHRHGKAGAPASSAPIILPFNAQEISKHDLRFYEPMFAMYLDIQKEILLEDLSPEEVKGRWKSFVRKWNRGELAEGWYDPETLRKARKSAKEGESYFAGPSRRSSPDYEHGREEEDEGEGSRVDRVSRHPEEDRLRRADREDRNEEEDEEEDYGPVLPETQGQQLKHSSGPTIPKLQDLELRKEMAIEDAEFAHEQSKLYHRAAARSHRDEMKEMQDFVAPRAEPGTHERRLEKRREAAAANRAFAESSRRGGSPEAAPDEELMGSGENDLEVLKKAQEKEKRKKNEREIRREEILRARAAEREERVKRYRQKEEETIGWLKTLAKQRFG